MWNIVFAVAISLVQVIAVLLMEKKYDCLKKESCNNKFWVLHGIILVLSCLLNMMLFRQMGNDWLLLVNFIMIYTVVQISGVIDFHCHKIPNSVLLMGAGVRILILLLIFIFSREFFATELIMSLVGCIVSLLVMLLISIVSKQGIGYGDVKLYACLGLYLGIMDTYYILFYAALLAALYAAYFLLSKKGNRKSRIPFGPFTYLGFVLVYLFSFM